MLFFILMLHKSDPYNIISNREKQRGLLIRLGGGPWARALVWTTGVGDRNSWQKNKLPVSPKKTRQRELLKGEWTKKINSYFFKIRKYANSVHAIRKIIVFTHYYTFITIESGLRKNKNYNYFVRIVSVWDLL